MTIEAKECPKCKRVYSAEGDLNEYHTKCACGETLPPSKTYPSGYFEFAGRKAIVPELDRAERI